MPDDAQCPDCTNPLAVAVPGCANHDLYYEIHYLKQDLRKHRARCAALGEVERLRRVEDTLVELGAPNTGGLMIAWIGERMAELTAARTRLAAHTSPEQCASTWAARFEPDYSRQARVDGHQRAGELQPATVEVSGWCEHCGCDVSGENHYHCHRCGQRTSMMGHRDGCPPAAPPEPDTDATEQAPLCGEAGSDPEGMCGEPVPDGVCSEHGEVGASVRCTSTYANGVATCSLPPGDHIHKSAPDSSGHSTVWTDNASDQAVAKMDPEAQKLSRLLSAFVTVPQPEPEPKQDEPDATPVCPQHAWSAEMDGDRGLKLARAEAKRKGWVRKRANGKLIDLCPDCAADIPVVGDQAPGGES
jgi:hypothetical protein